MNKSEIARSYRDKFPDMPTLKLARIIFKEHNLQFKDVEDARYSLRRIEGKGEKRYKNIPANQKYIREEPRPYNPYKLPESDETIYKPFEFPHHKKIGILSDVHLPYHSLDALTEALTTLKKEKVDALLLNGDTIDCHQLSRFMKDPKKRDFKYELDCLKSFFDKFVCFFYDKNNKMLAKHLAMQLVSKKTNKNYFVVMLENMRE